MTVLSVTHGDLRAPTPGIIIDVPSTIAPNGTSDCATHTTCPRCTDARCVWSNKDQTCVEVDATIDAPENLTVDDGSLCPKFSVDYAEKDGDDYVTVTVSAKQQALVGLLNGTKNKLCHLKSVSNNFTIDGNRIVCHWKSKNKNPYYGLEPTVSAWYFWIEFDGKTLRFDNVRDHYVVIEPKRNCANDSCVNCLWEDGLNRYYCIWCPAENTCGGKAYQDCNVQNLRDLKPLNTKNVTMTDDRCSEARIKLRQADGSNTVRITVHDHRMLLSYKNEYKMTATVAGHRCDNLSYHNDTITCTVSSSVNVAPVYHGPVDITYKGPTRQLTLRSGNRFDIVNYDNEPDRVQSSASTTNCPPDDAPAVDANQTFVGIASGGYEFWVRGRNLASLENVSVHADSSTIRHNSCAVKNGTHMTCRPPTTDGDVQDVIHLSLYFEAVVQCSGKTVNLSLPSRQTPYSLYPDPVFTDFTVNGCCNVTINGMNLDHGYNITDLSVRLAANSSSECLVTELEPRRIVCQLLPSTPPLPTTHQTMEIAIGIFRTKIRNLKKDNRFNSSARSSSHSNSVDYLPSVFAIGAYVSFIVFLCVILVRLKTSKQYDLLTVHLHQPSTEMKTYDDCKSAVETEPLNGLRHNINDSDDNDGVSEITKREKQ